MADPSNEEIVRRYMEAHRIHDHATIGALSHPEWACEYPQTGERIRGVANLLAILGNWPGGHPEGLFPRLTGSEDRWVMTPANTIQRIVGSGDTWWFDGTSAYPDGSSWFVSGLLTLREGLVHRETWYFGPSLEAPAWRSQWVEPIA
jgi:hypothetical protein